MLKSKFELTAILTCPHSQAAWAPGSEVFKWLEVHEEENGGGTNRRTQWYGSHTMTNVALCS